MFRTIASFFVVLVLLSCSSDDDNNSSGSAVSEVNSTSVFITATMTLEEILASGAATVAVGDTYFAIGHRQITANNKDPILLRYDNGELSWARTDYEMNTDDGTGTGLIYSPSNDRLHVVFTATGTQGNASTDYRRFTENGWLPNYGFGGGSKVVVLTQINPDNGDPLSGTFVYSKLSNMETNFLEAVALRYSGNRIELEARSGFSPLKIDQTSFDCSGSSPIDYTISFNLDLTEALSASAEDCQ